MCASKKWVVEIPILCNFSACIPPFYNSARSLTKEINLFKWVLVSLRENSSALSSRSLKGLNCFAKT